MKCDQISDGEARGSMTKHLPYPPPWQDSVTLAAHISVSVSTLENWVAPVSFLLRENVGASSCGSGQRLIRVSPRATMAP